MRKFGPLFLCLCLAPSGAHAQGAAPDLFGVREVLVDYARFDDAKASGSCGLYREHIAEVLARSLKGSRVPWFSPADAKPQALGIARISLVPEISSFEGDNLDCVSWISLTAESRTSAVIPPVGTLRSVNVVYWQQHTRVSSSQSIHAQKIDDILEKLAAQFAQQYGLDQPPELSKPLGGN
jgi:hypothetical protein